MSERTYYNGRKCWDESGLHYHKGMIVSGVRPYPAECMECGRPITYRDEEDTSNGR